jgi:hypothetical protein
VISTRGTPGARRRNGGARAGAALETESERCQDFRTAWPARGSEGPGRAVVKAGRRQHSRRFETATRISRVMETWTGPIWAMIILWVAMSLRVKVACWLASYARTPRWDHRPCRPGFGPILSLGASFATICSTRPRTPGFRCTARFVGGMPSRRGTRSERGASCHDGVDPNWEPWHLIESPRCHRCGRGILV